mmetsp:Transcript_10166/g.8712  ORF Transcript_10166/g.8712 Transcript_10166/m.8712 type:complete len:159 (-) Transcript_10166:179-655(-)
MMQDYPKLLKSCDRVGVTQIDKIFSFSACKNDIKSAAEKFSKNLPPECAASCEHDFYRQCGLVLKAAGVDVQTSEKFNTYAGINHQVIPKIILRPSFGVTLKEIKSKIKGKVIISPQSTVVLEGDTILEDITIDGSVHLKDSKLEKGTQLTDKHYVTF